MVALRMLVACGLVAAGISGVCAETSPYAGMQNRGLKALSEQQIEDLRRGMGMALAAELNGSPGPAHLLELASALDLSEAQRGRTQALFEEMQRTAMPLGNEVLAKETELDQAFAGGRIDDASFIVSWPTSAGCKASFATPISNITSPCAACSAQTRSPSIIVYEVTIAKSRRPAPTDVIRTERDGRLTGRRVVDPARDRCRGLCSNGGMGSRGTAALSGDRTMGSLAQQSRHSCR